MAAGLVSFRVYEVTFDDGYVGRIAMSALRETSFRRLQASAAKNKKRR